VETPFLFFVVLLLGFMNIYSIILTRTPTLYELPCAAAVRSGIHILLLQILTRFFCCLGCLSRHLLDAVCLGYKCYDILRHLCPKCGSKKQLIN